MCFFGVFFRWGLEDGHWRPDAKEGDDPGRNPAKSGGDVATKKTAGWSLLNGGFKSRELPPPPNPFKQGSLNYPFEEDETMQMYGDVEGFPF